ncbi:MAG TPA: succinate dehydrogenase/fumarate reductase iron-sulfur subunit [Solirubrobacteraceae bacterium]|jgi:succinate dehydrogenase / fumarate reductase, iron-sulfur subunit|nr:succinate dehydrogenase/fumarate reductase iron-sulfur subunit [Solirubrobacteraceae bacterium]
MPAYALRVLRQNPEDPARAEPYWVEETVELDAHRSVLDALIEIKQRDGTLAVRYSCRAAICGSCGVRVNGRPDLACHRQLGVAQQRSGKGPIVVEPMGNMPVIKDLVVDMDSVHWAKIKRVQPWLIAREPVPEREYVVAHEAMVDTTQTQACIQCGACVSNCLSMEVDPLFVGPAGLAKAFRFVVDPRDSHAFERLEDLAQDPHGMYECTHCFECIEACPKGVQPMNQIMRLRRAANADHQIVDRNNGHRHEAAFVDNVRRNGLLNEADLMAGSYGGRLHPRFLPQVIQSLPLLLTGVRRRKIGREAIGHRHRKRFKELRRIFDTLSARPERVELNLYVTGYEDEPGAQGSTSAGTAADAAATATGPNPRRSAPKR